MNTAKQQIINDIQQGGFNTCIITIEEQIKPEKTITTTKHKSREKIIK